MASSPVELPVPKQELSRIATEAVEAALGDATTYVHSSCEAWNRKIINQILHSLIEATTTDADPQPAYKFAVNSTIIQHQPGDAGGRRGMHASAGAFWNNDKDCMWSWKYDGAKEGGVRGLDVVVSVIFVSV